MLSYLGKNVFSYQGKDIESLHGKTCRCYYLGSLHCYSFVKFSKQREKQNCQTYFSKPGEQNLKYSVETNLQRSEVYLAKHQPLLQRPKVDVHTYQTRTQHDGIIASGVYFLPNKMLLITHFFSF